MSLGMDPSERGILQEQQYHLDADEEHAGIMSGMRFVSHDLSDIEIPAKFYNFAYDYQTYLTILHWLYRTKAEFDNCIHNTEELIVNVNNDRFFNLLEEMSNKIEELSLESSSLYFCVCRTISRSLNTLYKLIHDFYFYLQGGFSPYQDFMVENATKQEEARRTIFIEFNDLQKLYHGHTKQLFEIMENRFEKEETFLFNSDIEYIKWKKQNNAHISRNRD